MFNDIQAAINDFGLDATFERCDGGDVATIKVLFDEAVFDEEMGNGRLRARQPQLTVSNSDLKATYREGDSVKFRGLRYEILDAIEDDAITIFFIGFKHESNF